MEKPQVMKVKSFLKSIFDPKPKHVNSVYRKPFKKLKKGFQVIEKLNVEEIGTTHNQKRVCSENHGQNIRKKVRKSKENRLD